MEVVGTFVLIKLALMVMAHSAPPPDGTLMATLKGIPVNMKEHYFINPLEMNILYTVLVYFTPSTIEGITIPQERGW